jgi:hypothetical protein
VTTFLLPSPLQANERKLKRRISLTGIYFAPRYDRRPIFWNPRMTVERPGVNHDEIDEIWTRVRRDRGTWSLR